MCKIILRDVEKAQPSDEGSGNAIGRMMDGKMASTDHQKMLAERGRAHARTSTHILNHGGGGGGSDEDGTAMQAGI